MLTPDELRRYGRHLVLQGFGKERQELLKKSSVAIVGLGGLGCPASLYLAAAGVGKLGLFDFDMVQESNLQRQVLFTTDDVGKPKAMAAADRLTALNPHVSCETHTEKLTSQNALQLLQRYDLVLDGSDNFPTRYLVNDACVLLNKTLVYASILEFEGQLAVFNYPLRQHRSTNYRDLFPQPPEPDSVPDCATAGVLGVLPGIMGSLMATEAIKVLSGVGEPLYNKLLLFDALSLATTVIQIPDRQAAKSIASLIDYEHFCGLNQPKPTNQTMKEVSVQQLAELKQAGGKFQLIDVRESYEYELCNIGGEHIPLHQIPHSVERIDKNIQVIIHCRSGSRSSQAVMWLEKNHGLRNLYSLKGGIQAWATEIDPEMIVD